MLLSRLGFALTLRQSAKRSGNCSGCVSVLGSLYCLSTFFTARSRLLSKELVSRLSRNKPQRDTATCTFMGRRLAASRTATSSPRQPRPASAAAKMSTPPASLRECACLSTTPPALRGTMSQLRVRSPADNRLPPSSRRAPAGMVNLAVGHPADKLLPRAVLAAAAAAASHAIAAVGSDIGYGRSAGPGPFCDALARFLCQEHSRSPALASELFVTNGASHALELALGTLTSPGDVVLVERPTYFLGAHAG